MMEGRGSAAASRGSLAARALQGSRVTAKDRGGLSRGASRMSSGKDNWEGGAPRVSVPSASSRPAPGQDTRRFKQVALIAAFAIGVAVVSLAYGVWTAASSGAAVEAATAGALPTLVSSVDIHAGDIVDGSLVETKNIPQSFRAPAALGADALTVEGYGEGRRALVDIPAGTQITPGFVSGTENGSHLAAQLQSGREAVTLSVDTETGLAGHVQAYDVVRIVAAESASTDSSLLETVCERARVIATGEGLGGGEGSYTSVTVEVTPSEADAVREAQYAGRVSLLLISSNDALEGGAVYGQND